MRIYELVYIVRPDIPEDEVESTVALVEETISSGGGEIDQIEKWGKRRLAYKVRKHSDGFYVLARYKVENNDLPKEVERRLRVNDRVIKFLTIRIDEDLKRAEKLKAQREKRSERKPGGGSGGGGPRPGSPAPSAPAPGLPRDESTKPDEDGDES